MDTPTTELSPGVPPHTAIRRRIGLAVKRTEATWQGIQMRKHYRCLAAACLVGFWMIAMSASAAPPEGTTPRSPSGTVTEARPSFTWDAVDGATWHRIWISRNGVAYWEGWVEEATWTPGWDMTDYPGNYEWWVQTWGPGGYGPWSGSLSFTIAGQEPPDTTTLRSPSDTVTEARPTFTWDAVDGATWYQIWINRNGAVHWHKWMQETTWRPWWDMTDYPGNYGWWVQTWGPGGHGPRSSSLSFTIAEAGPPGAARLRTPNGTVGVGDVSFTWDLVDGATWYHFWLNKDGAAYDSTWLKGETTRTLTLTTGQYGYWVRTWGPGGYGSWSEGLSFAVSVAVSGTVTGVVQEEVTIVLSGDASATTTTAADGSYTFSVVDGTYTITPSLSGYIFTDMSETVTVTGEGIANVNFVSSLSLEGGDATAERWEAINPRWIRNYYADGAITMSDKDTGLMWVYDADAHGIDNSGDAGRECSNLVYARYSDWRLPNRDQLAAMYSQKGYFSDVRSTNYWSSTPSHYGGSYSGVYSVDMEDGEVYSSYANRYFRVWPCRGGY